MVSDFDRELLSVAELSLEEGAFSYKVAHFCLDKLGHRSLSSGSSQHEVINAKMDRFCDAFEGLKEKVGVERALELTAQIMEHCSEQKPRRDAQGRVSHEEIPS